MNREISLDSLSVDKNVKSECYKSIREKLSSIKQELLLTSILTHVPGKGKKDLEENQKILERIIELEKLIS